MSAVLRSILNNSYRTYVYVLLVLVAFIAMNVIINTYFVSVKLIGELDAALGRYLNETQPAEETKELFDIRSVIDSSLPFVRISVVLSVLLCCILLPLFQYMLNLALGYEIAVMRILGMSKARAMRRMFAENIILVLFSFCVNTVLMLIFHKTGTMAMLSIDTDTLSVLNAHIDVNNVFAYDFRAVSIMFAATFAVILVSNLFCNALISHNAPLNLIRSFK